MFDIILTYSLNL